MIVIACVGQMQHHVGIFHRRPCALNTDFFHHIVGLAQPSSINDVQRYAVNLDGLADRVARRAGDVGDDGDVFFCQCI